MKAVRKVKPYLYILPVLLFAVLFTYYPFARTLTHAFSVVNSRGQILSFAGFENFQYLFGRRDFGTALSNTLVLTAVNVPLTVIITMLLAALCTRRNPLSPVNETLIAIPMAVSMSAVSLIFSVLLNPSAGWVNKALQLSLGWFQDRKIALWGVLLINIWQGIGFNFLLFLAAFRSIPRPVTEAAKVDGASAFRILIHIHIPQIFPTLLYVICTNTVLCLMTAGPILIIIRGSAARASATLLSMMYNSGYSSSDYSTAACIAVITFLIAIAFTALGLYAEQRRNEQ